MPRKWTNEMFVDALRQRHPALEPLEAYVNNKAKISVRCNNCGNVWQTTPATLLNGSGCAFCASQKVHALQRKSNEEFMKQLSEVNPGIEPVDRYVNAKARIRFRCKQCGQIWLSKPNQVLRGSGCPNCSRTGTSLFEQAIRFACISALPDVQVLSRDKTAIGFELDIYIPSRHLAFEPGGWVWHRNKTSADKQKAVLCKARGIRLITIYTSCPLDSSKFDFEVITTNKHLSFGAWDEVASFTASILEIANIPHSSIDWAFVRQEAIFHDRRRTTEEFNSILYELHPDVEVLDEYVSATSNLRCHCKRCGYSWLSNAHKLLRGKGCLRCSGSWIPTNEEFRQRLADINPNAQALESYSGADRKIKTKCLVCRNEWDAKPSELLRGHGCPICAGNQRKGHGEFVAELRDLNPDIEVLGHYVSSREKIRCRCLICANEWEPIPNNLLRGASCPVCSKGKTNSVFIDEIRAVNPSVQLLSPYVRSKEKVNCRCMVCGHEWSALPNNLLRGSGCPNCARQKTSRFFIKKTKS